MAIVYMTQEGYDKKMAELDHLENIERPEVINAIREARIPYRLYDIKTAYEKREKQCWRNFSN